MPILRWSNFGSRRAAQVSTLESQSSWASALTSDTLDNTSEMLTSAHDSSTEGGYMPRRRGADFLDSMGSGELDSDLIPEFPDEPRVLATQGSGVHITVDHDLILETPRGSCAAAADDEAGTAVEAEGSGARELVRQYSCVTLMDSE